MDEKDVQWLYGKLKSQGYNIGSESEFRASLANKQDRDWYYNKAVSMGLNMGTRDDFEGMYTPAEKKASKAATTTAAAQPTTKPLGWHERLMQTATELAAKAKKTQPSSSASGKGKARDEAEAKPYKMNPTLKAIAEAYPAQAPALGTEAKMGEVPGKKVVYNTAPSSQRPSRERATVDPAPVRETARRKADAEVRAEAGIAEAEKAADKKWDEGAMERKVRGEQRLTTQKIDKQIAELTKRKEEIEGQMEELEKEIRAAHRADDRQNNVLADLADNSNNMGYAGILNDTESTKVIKADPRWQNLRAQYITLERSITQAEEAKANIDSDKWIAAGDTEDKGIRTLGSFFAGAWRGIKDAATDLAKYNSLTDLGIAVGNLGLIEKANKVGFENLTAEEQKELNTVAQAAAADEQTSGLIGRGYKAGQVTAEAVPFMVEMALNPASGIGEGAAKFVTKQAVKKYGAAVVKNNMKKYLAAKVGARVLGDAAGSAAMAATTGQIGVLTDATERMTGDVQSTVDENGNVVYAGTEGAEDSFLTAYAKAFGARTIENHSEMVGNYFGPILKGAGKAVSKAAEKVASTKVGGKIVSGVEKGVQKIGLDKAKKFIDDVGSTGAAKIIKGIEEKAQWHGTLGEYAEEVVGGIENALLVGDDTLDTAEGTGVFNLDRNIDTFLGVTLMGGFFSAVKTGQYRGEKTTARNEMDNIGRSIDRALEGNMTMRAKWGEWRNALLIGSDEEQKATLRTVLDDKEVPWELRKAVLSYSKAAQKWKGIVKAEASAEEEQLADEQEAAIDAADAAENGAEGPTLDEDNPDNNKPDDPDAEGPTAGPAAPAIPEWMTGKESEPLTPVQAGGWRRGYHADDTESRDIYVESRNPYNEEANEAWNAVVQRETDKADEQAAKAREDAKQKVHKDGNYYVATLKEKDEEGRDQQVYIVEGNVVMTEDGTMVDSEKSDKTIVVYNPATGMREMRDPSADTGILSVDNVVTGEEMEESIVRDRDDLIRSRLDGISGTLRFEPGGRVPLPNGEEALILAVNVGSVVVIKKDGKQARFSMHELQKANDKRMRDEYNERHGAAPTASAAPVAATEEATHSPETEPATVGATPAATTGTAAEPAETAAEPAAPAAAPAAETKSGAIEGAPAEYERDTEIVISEDGKETPAMIMGRVRYENGEFVPDDNGNIVEYYADGEVHHEHASSLSGKVVRHTPANYQAEEAKTEEVASEPAAPMTEDGVPTAPISEATPAETAAPAASTPAATEEAPRAAEAAAVPAAEQAAAEQAVSSEQPTATAEQPKVGVEPMPMRADGEEDWQASTPERAHSYIYNEAGLTRRESSDFVAAKLEEAKKTLRKAQSAQMPRIGTSIQKFRQAQAKRQEKIDEAQRAVEYWNRVREIQNGVQQQENEQKAAEDAARHEAAVEEAQKDYEARKQAEAERKAVGNENPMPAITEKWNGGKKYDGDRDDYKIADGTTLKGHYVLHESGASSPSHNPQNWQQTEGFPMDANDNSVNDRDYEHDRDAQEHTKRIAENYDQRALQDVPVVSADGVVLSGNGRTMAGELAAQNNTDSEYVEYLKEHAHKFGFTREQVESMQHPRVSFVPDEAMPYTAETFSRFNQQAMKSQNKTEQAVKLGKTVSDESFKQIVRTINGYDSLSEFYADPEASLGAVYALHNAGVIPQAQLAEMVDGVPGQQRLSAVGREFLENMLIGKAFDNDPEVVRMLTAEPAMRQTVITALGEIADNIALGGAWSVKQELADAVKLCFDARTSGAQYGDIVSVYARQGELFADPDQLQTMADFKNATMLMLADVLNDKRVTLLKTTLQLYNNDARLSASGQADLFAGGVKSREDILRGVINYINENYGKRKELDAARAAAVERRKAESVQQNGTPEEGSRDGEKGNTEASAVRNDGRGSGVRADAREGDLAQTEEIGLSDENNKYVVSSAERAEMENRIVDWLSEENLERAVGKTREEIIEEFGNDLAPIAFIPAKHLSLLGGNVKDPRIYCGKGYFIDHALRNHGGQGSQVNIDDIDVSKYLNIQYVLDNPDHIKETFTDGKRTVVFIKKIGRYFAELTQVEENGRIVLHKSLFNQKKEPYAKLADIRPKGASSEGGVSSISHADNAAPAISLQSRGDAVSEEGKEGNTLQTAAQKPHGGIAPENASEDGSTPISPADSQQPAAPNVSALGTSSAAKVSTKSEGAKGEGEKGAEEEERTPYEVWKDTKEKHPDNLVLVRHGDTYVAYGEDATACARALDIATQTDSENQTVEAGFGHHALDVYLPRLISEGHKVAIVDMSKPKRRPQFQTSDASLSLSTPEQRMAYDAVSDLLEEAGVEVEMLSDEEMRRMAEESEGGRTPVRLQDGYQKPATLSEIPTEWKDSKVQSMQAVPVASPFDIPDEIFTDYTQSVILPRPSKGIEKILGGNTKPILIKRGVFAKNDIAHGSSTKNGLTPEQSRTILNDALYSGNLVGKTQPATRPNYWVVIRTAKKNKVVVLEVSQTKEFLEVVGWEYRDESGLSNLYNQARDNHGAIIEVEKEDGSGDGLTPIQDAKSSAADLSALTTSSTAKLGTSSETSKGEGKKVSERSEERGGRHVAEQNADGTYTVDGESGLRPEYKTTEKLPEKLNDEKYLTTYNLYAGIAGNMGLNAAARWQRQNPSQVSYRDAFPTPTIEDYYVATRARFNGVELGGRSASEVWEEMKSSGKYEWHKSPLSDSEYLIDAESGEVYRKADHWGRVASCTWLLPNEEKFRDADGFAIAHANIKDFGRTWSDRHMVANPNTEGFGHALRQTIVNYTDALNNLPMTEKARGWMREAIASAQNALDYFENTGKSDRTVRMLRNDATVYGAMVGSKMYLNAEHLNVETPVHEYTHMWDEMCARKNPELWKRGVALMKACGIWDEVANDPAYQGLDEFGIASECHARLTGRHGAETLERLAKGAKDKKGLIGKLREWLSEFWYWLRDTMLPWSAKEAGKVKLEDFVNMPLVDLAKGRRMDLATQTVAEVTRGNGKRFDVKKERDAEAEVREIVEKAKADGTYMKAPNGKDSKLSERQWAQVRTKAFKNWFGDWEKAARIEKLRKSAPIEITGEEVTPSEDLKQYKKNALEYGKSLRGEYTNKDTGAKVQISAQSIKEVLHHDYKDREHLQSVAAIPQMIENGIFIEALPNEETDKNIKVTEYQYYVCGLKIGGVDYTAKFVVSVDNNGNRYYDHKLTQIEKGKLLNELDRITSPSSREASALSDNNPEAGSGKTSPSAYEVVSGGKDIRLISILQTNSSKVVDENGDPLVVYHGTASDEATSTWDESMGTYDTSHAPFTVFRREVEGERNRGFFFSSEEDNAGGYGYNTYDTYLNLKNPLVIDCKGSGYDAITFDGQTMDTYEWAEYAERNGYDGVVFANVADGVDYGAMSQPTTDYVAFKSTQIKSATDNEGTFSASNPDIRFHISRRNGETIDRLLDKGGLFDEKGKAAFRTYVENEEPSVQLAMAKWAGNGSIRLPEDRPTVDEALKICRKDKLDAMRYDSPGAIVKEWRDKNVDEEAEADRVLLSPDEERFSGVLTNKREYADGVTVYDVADTREGQKAVRELMNDHLTVDGKHYNCWCLLYASESTGDLSDSAWDYWNNYNSVQKKVAFKDGKIVSFCASNTGRDEWWDLSDRSHGERIPVEMKLPNDRLGRSAMVEFNPESGESVPVGNKFSGNKKNGLYREWNEDDVMVLSEHYKGRKLDGVREKWTFEGFLERRENYKNGMREGVQEHWGRGWYGRRAPLRAREKFKNDERDGLTEYFYPDGELERRANYKDGKLEGLFEEWYDNGQMWCRRNYKDGDVDGLDEVWDKDGNLVRRENYKNGKRDGLSEEWHPNGRLKCRENYKDGEQNGLCEVWSDNGQLISRSYYKGGEPDGLAERWYSNGEPIYRINYKNGEPDGLSEQYEHGRLSYRKFYKNGVEVPLPEEYADGAMYRSAKESERKQWINSYAKALHLVTGRDEKALRAEATAKYDAKQREVKELYERVLSGNFDAVTLQRINDYIDNYFKNNVFGRPLSKRLPQRVGFSLREGERTSAVDALFSRISEGAVGKNERTRPEAKRRIAEKKKELLKKWAIATGNWHTSVSDFTDAKEPMGRGKDSVVYAANDGKHVIKVSKGKDHLKKFRPDIDAVVLFNTIFPNSHYEILGYGEVDGKFVKFLKQPIVDFTESTPLSDEERVAYMKSMGFEALNEDKTVFSNGTYIVSDLQGTNIVKDAAGNIRVIDADVKLHTKDVGGSYTYQPVEVDTYVPNERTDDATYREGEADETLSSPAAKAAKVRELEEKFGVPVEIVEDASTITHENKAVEQRRRQAKGWYDTRTGRVVVVLENNEDVEDVAATVYHETVGHRGLRELVGEENFNAFLDDVFAHLSKSLKERIVRAAARTHFDDVATAREQGRKAQPYEAHRRAAVEEMLAEMAEKPFEEFSGEERTLWQKIRDAVLRAIDKMLEGVKLPSWVRLGDNELRYILWRSKQNLESGQRDVTTLARDAQKREELGLTDTAMYREEGETDDIWGDRSMGLDERITAAATRLAQLHADSRQMRNEALQAINQNLASLRRAMGIQREYDQTTVKRVADLARVLITNRYLDNMGAQEVKRLLSVVKASVGRADLSKCVDTIMDVMIAHQLKQSEEMLHQLEKIRGSKVDARGVEVQGQLDVAGQKIMEAFKKARHWTMENVDDALADAQERMGSDNTAVAEEAALEYTGLTLAKEYIETIGNSKVDEDNLRKELREMHDNTEESERATATYRQQADALRAAIRQCQIERAEAYIALVGKLSGDLRKSIANAQAFREAEQERVRQIHHNANSDMEGRPDGEHTKETFWDKVANNSLVQFIISPLATFEQMMRMFGSKSANGEGYLFNRFVRGWVNCREKEIRGMRGKLAILNAKAREVFGKKAKTWGELISYSGKLPKVVVTFRNGNETQRFELTQGHLMYIYMVNKMLDGQMKLRRMGITEEEVERITAEIDPRLLEIADWIQEEFLVDSRNEYNETHKRVFGASMAAIDDYFPLLILSNARVDKAEDLDAPDRNNGISTKTGSIIKRRRNSLALDLLNANALNVVLDHIAEMEHWNAYVEYNRDLNTLRTYKRFRNQVQNIRSVYGSGKQLWKNFNDVCQMATGSYRPPRAKLDKLATNVARGVTTAKVSARFWTALKQILSVAAYIPDIRTDLLLKAMATPVSTWNWAMENLPILRERWESMQIGDPRLRKSDLDFKQWRSQLVQTCTRIGMTPNAFVDALACCIGARGVYETRYKQYRKEGLTQEQAHAKAIQDAEMLYNLTQQSSEGPFTSTVQVDRSWLSVVFTVFRNSNMSYQRQIHDAVRNLMKHVDPEERDESIAFMAKQLEREGVDHGTAYDAAKIRMNRQLRRDLLRVMTFAFICQWAWNLGSNAIYLLIGDDDDEKEKLIDEANAKSMFGWLEGFTGGDIMAQAGQYLFTGTENAYSGSLRKDMPLSSDILNVVNKAWNGKWGEVGNDVINLGAQVGIGVNPQSFIDGVTGIMDACGDDPNLTHGAAILIGRIINAPQSQLRKLYFDEVNAMGDEASKYTPEQLAERYARYEVKRGQFWMFHTWNDEEALGKKEDAANKKIKERAESSESRWVDETYDEMLERTKPMREKISKARAMLKKDYVAGAKMLQEAYADTNAMREYKLFTAYDNNLDKLATCYMNAQTPEEATLCYNAMRDFKRGMVHVLKADDETRQLEEQEQLVAGYGRFVEEYTKKRAALMDALNR